MLRRNGLANIRRQKPKLSKWCPGCHAERPAGDFYKNSKRGLMGYCIECTRRKYIATGKKKESDAKSYRLHRTERLASQKEYVAANATKVKATRKKWYESNRSKISEKRCADRAANPSKYKRLYAKQKDKSAARYRVWASKNRAHLAERQRRRHASVVGATIQKFTKDDLFDRFSVFGHRCAYCGATWKHVDHVKPLSRGGPHCLSNLRPACVSCNSSKYNKPLSIWLKAAPKSLPMPLPG